MKILLINNAFWNIYNFRLNLIEEIQQNTGAEISLYAPRDLYFHPIEKMEKYHCHHLAMSQKGTNPFRDSFLIMALYSIFLREKPSVILTFTVKPNIYASIAARLLNIPVINNISGLGTLFIKQNFLTTIAKQLYKLALSKNNYVFFQNSHDLEVFRENKLLNKCKYGLLPGSGVDTTYFSPAYPLTNKGCKVLFVGRLLRDKGFHEYAEAAAMIREKYPHITFSVAGQLGAENKTAISKEELRYYTENQIINYLGASNDMRKTLEEHDIVVLPSYREGMSKALLEAASMAKPIVTTNVPGCKDIVDHGVTGFLCEAKNAEDLSQKMMDMILLPEQQRIAMGMRSREKMIRQFEERIVIDKYIAAIKAIKSTDHKFIKKFFVGPYIIDIKKVS